MYMHVCCIYIYTELAILYTCYAAICEIQCIVYEVATTVLCVAHFNQHIDYTNNVKLNCAIVFMLQQYSYSDNNMHISFIISNCSFP